MPVACTVVEPMPKMPPNRFCTCWATVTLYWYGSAPSPTQTFVVSPPMRTSRAGVHRSYSGHRVTVVVGDLDRRRVRPTGSPGKCTAPASAAASAARCSRECVNCQYPTSRASAVTPRSTTSMMTSQTKTTPRSSAARVDGAITQSGSMIVHGTSGRSRARDRLQLEHRRRRRASARRYCRRSR